MKCARGFPDDCLGGNCNGIQNNDLQEDEHDERYDNDDSRENDEKSNEEATNKGTRVRRHKADFALKDQQSTGRKRAAKAYPLYRNESCEWRGKSNCGGGKFPIQGCSDGLQQCRHHGPDYDTLNNEEGNVHRICYNCHNRWHAANDATKNETYLKLYGHEVKDLGKTHRKSKIISREELSKLLEIE